MIALLLACIVKYGDPPPPVAYTEGGAVVERADTPAPVDFREVDKRLGALLRESASMDVDRRDRIVAAQELARAFRGQDPRAQREVFRYLTRLVDIEERFVPEDIPMLGVDGTGPVMGIAEFDLGAEDRDAGDTGARPSDTGDTGAVVLDPDVQERAAREALARQAYEEAIDLLEPLDGTEAWSGLQSVYREAVDGFVHATREAAGAAFLAAREIDDPVERRPALEQVAAQLADLLARYPDSLYVQAIRKNLAQVEAELAILEP